MMWRRSLSLPGLGGLPAAIQRSRAWPPFQARVVKPRISTLTPQRSSVRARMSALIAATVIARAGHQLAFALVGARRVAVLLFLVGRAAFERALRAGRGTLIALTLVLALVALVAVVLAVLFTALVLDFAEVEIEVLDELPCHLAISGLVTDRALEFQ